MLRSTSSRRLRAASTARRRLSTTSATAASNVTPPLTLGNRPFRVGVVGGGPAGFYAASRLLGLAGSENIRVDLFELLPTPFGLARFGVAPDHPEVKNCEHKFEETARDPRFRFFGNVQVGGIVPSPSSSSSSLPSSIVVPNLSPSPLAAQITLSDLQPHYDAILLTYGASLDRPLGIPGDSTLSNVLSARSFVNWYNGHPYHSALLAPLIDLSKLEHVTVVGQGNVALDVARILLKDPEALEEFDVPETVLDELRRSRVKRVEIVGRRGPLQLACTTKEVRELMNLPGVGFETDRALLKQAMEDVEANPKMDMARMRKRALGLLDKGSKTKMVNAERSWSFEFLKSPLELLPPGGSPGSSNGIADVLSSAARVGSVHYGINELVGSGDPSQLSARATGQTITTSTDMVLKSVGYRSIGLPGLPFDEKRGIVRNEEGRVVDERGQAIRGLYTSGWLARGPNGVIATTMFDSFATADLIGADLSSLPVDSEGRPELPMEQLRGDRRVVSWEDWEILDREERRRGKERGKLREKMTEVKEMLEVLA